MEHPPTTKQLVDGRPRPYNGIAIQRGAILERLAKGPATGARLQAECHVPDPTARIHELRTECRQIDTCWTDQANPDGSVNRVAVYVLRSEDDRQLELIPFE